MAWKTLIPFLLPSVLFVILSSVNFHPYVCFSAVPSQLSASCLLGSLHFLSFFFVSRLCKAFFFRSLSLCRRDCGLTEVQILCCFIHFSHLFFFFFHPGLFFIATRRYIVNIDFKLGSENPELESNITMPVKRRKIPSWCWCRFAENLLPRTVACVCV